MVRTKADNTARKAVAAKAPRKILGSSGGGGGGASSSAAASPASNKYAGGNPACPRPTPEWQKGIASFLVNKPPSAEAKDKENSKPEDENVAAASAGGSSSSEGTAAGKSTQGKGKGTGKKSSKKAKSDTVDEYDKESAGSSKSATDENMEVDSEPEVTKNNKSRKNGVIESDDDE